MTQHLRTAPDFPEDPSLGPQHPHWAAHTISNPSFSSSHTSIQPPPAPTHTWAFIHTNMSTWTHKKLITATRNANEHTHIRLKPLISYYSSINVL